MRLDWDRSFGLEVTEGCGDSLLVRDPSASSNPRKAGLTRVPYLTYLTRRPIACH